MRAFCVGLGAGAVVTMMAFASSARAQGLQPPPPLTPQQMQPMQQPMQPGLQPAPPLSQDQQQPWQQQPSGYGYGAQQRLTQSEQEDSGRGFEIAWANVEVGGGYLTPGKELGDGKGAIMTGVGAGVRFLTWTLGARFRLLAIPDATMWTLGGEAGFHLPTGRWDPYVNLHAGYAHLAGSNAPADFPSTHGLDLGVSVGSDYYVTSFLSFGIDVTGDVLFLKRAAYAPALGGVTGAAVFYPEASSTGFALLGSIHGGLHFDL